jgi:signal transduction histidine kinase
LNKRRHSLFFKLLLIFFGAAIAIGASIMISYHFFSDKPYRRSFHKNIVAYTRLIADKLRFEPFSKAKIEKQAGVQIITSQREMGKLIAKKDLHFRPIATHISITKPGRKFFIKFDDGFDRFLIQVHNQDYHPENIDALLYGLMAALFILFLAYLLVNRTFKPIDQIQEIAKEYGQGKLDRRIPLVGSGQLMSLTESINELADRVQGMLEAKRSLFLAIGHELKTPLARMRLQLEMLDGKTAPIVKNLNEMTEIIDQLLEAERVTHHSELNKKEIQLSGFLQKFKAEDVVIDCDDALVQKVDEIRMELVIKNLISNSRKYAPESLIKIKAYKDQEKTIIEVSDNGPGVPSKTLDKLTEAFYRPDSARTREKGGVGLGLYLVKNIVEAHQGNLEFFDVAPGFGVRISL